MGKDDLKEILAQLMKQMNKTDELNEIEPLSKIYSKTPLYMSYFTALDKLISDSEVIISYTDHKQEIKTKTITNDNSFMIDFFKSYLRLSVSKSGYGREGIITIVKNAVKGLMLGNSASKLSVAKDPSQEHDPDF